MIERIPTQHKPITLQDCLALLNVDNYSCAADVRLAQADSCKECGGMRWVRIGEEIIEAPDVALKLAFVNAGYELRRAEVSAQKDRHRTINFEVLSHEGVDLDWWHALPDYYACRCAQDLALSEDWDSMLPAERERMEADLATREEEA